MLYQLLLLPAKIAIHLYCKRIYINDKSKLNEKGPLLIAANHPNSFLDAIIVASLFKRPIYSLARGDAFTNKLVIWILKSFNMLPVYRVSEGVENLGNNYSTFNACQHLFEKNKIVLIFSEGSSINEWHLRPLKKGTARLAYNAWNQNIPLKVLPLGINYDAFRSFGKTIHLNFGTVISKQILSENESFGKSINEFNSELNNQLQSLVYEIQPGDKAAIQIRFDTNVAALQQLILWIPAAIGWITHIPLYSIFHRLIYKKASDHYDSIMTGLLFLLYPIYLLIFSTILFLLIQSCWAYSAILLLPLSVLAMLHSGLLNRYK